MAVPQQSWRQADNPSWRGESHQDPLHLLPPGTSQPCRCGLCRYHWRGRVATCFDPCYLQRFWLEGHCWGVCEQDKCSKCPFPHRAFYTQGILYWLEAYLGWVHWLWFLQLTGIFFRSCWDWWWRKNAAQVWDPDVSQFPASLSQLSWFYPGDRRCWGENHPDALHRLQHWNNVWLCPDNGWRWDKSISERVWTLERTSYHCEQDQQGHGEVSHRQEHTESWLEIRVGWT